MDIQDLQSKTSRPQARVARTRHKLKQAALNCFSFKSVDATTIDEITQRAEVAKGTLYQHFADKEEIVVTLVDEAVDHLVEMIHDYDEIPEDLETMLEHLLEAHNRFSENRREEFLVLFQGKLLLKLQSETLDELEEPYLRYLQEIEQQVTPYLSPRINPLKVRRLACAVAGFVFGFWSFAMIGMDKQEWNESTVPLKRVFVKGLCAFLGR